MINDTSVRRIDKLKSAAVKFVEALLLPDFKDRISISLVPYSEQVNIGSKLFGALNVRQTHSFSHCVDLPASAFTSTTFSASTTYDQTQNVQFNAYGQGGFDTVSGSTRNQSNPDVDQPVCPRYSYEQIIPISQNSSALTTAIKQLQPRAGTSIFLGLKWGATLLDPSFQSTIAKLPSSMMDAAFADRPEAYDASDAASSKIRSLKYIVLMTDGFNDNSMRLKDEYYDDPSERYYWAHHNMSWATMNGTNSAPGLSTNTDRLPDYFYTRDQGVSYMRSMCTAA